MKLRIRLEKIAHMRVIYPEFVIDTIDYPRLEGKNTQEIRNYVVKYLSEFPSQSGAYDNLKEELENQKDYYPLNGDEDYQIYIEKEDERASG
ncbi:hypothetical protein [Aureibacter tunicatorum]|uniref:Uncharacterized protein n=1 Tax=Aureibacter tunicatorum TaxID=866807 RepID=A0AAE3XNE2_9BACT|nr:hypothetical protein [Aureibacter tunicatorum]MDR6239778.1 hypothetical protein [Aureibacter tunicatorum]BDD04253.1 hypothetical protein AUTU_17360 [Aureibacter tunicatorum]